MKRAIATLASTALLGAGLVGATAAPASAGAMCDGPAFYSIGDKKTVWVNTNIHSDWGKPGVTLGYTKNRTGTWTATGTATVGAEAGVIFAKASTSFSVSLGKSWSKSDTWSYSATVQKKKGKTMGRLMMQHEAKGFSVTKYRWVPKSGGTCKKEKVWKKSNNVAPVKKNSNLWGIQYR
ncbi:MULTISPECIES: hypothetical protein [unclassified Streptomyces]|uniref:hypothetical protein n=1 Tax=unclassified Streptomyces TaxID=2593676 RepID=UPI00224F77B7|nr:MULTISPECIES: hypothetical protein [unclassified Streptomyces]WSP57302.1 hypothetical protein OG306_25155 [Streptomyces sp. NBC_01241]WSU21979.1 hypothetical protein OG508_14065 [Streptomyces sp. NBC_01108]MCX4789121.1 hypothetical protein [Streptomyces sp. NBC_01221]MCX4795133.1 hypothetical protein [Streptomyces sp. NBC_01242]WSJ36437.1 hypothetical protein OG772_10610 [Streptomyces sp. NBC_01321]